MTTARPLAIDVKQFNMAEGLVGNIKSALARGLPELVPAIVRNDGTFVICGSGPSLANFAEEIRAEREKGRPICAVKGAHDWLVDQGIEPDLFVTLEPRDRRNNVRKPAEDTIYLIASRCHPSLFDHLSGHKVLLWHSYSQSEESECFKGSNKTLIGGASTSGMRAINIGYFLGFRKFVLYGFDSCNAEDGVTKRVDGSQTGKTIDVYVGSDRGKKFVCNLAMAKQAEEFQYIYAYMPDVEVEVKGDGLIAEIIKERKLRGYVT